MVFKMIERLSKNTIINAIFIFETFVRLLPSNIDKSLFRIISLDPTCTCKKNSFNKLTIITIADIEFKRLLWWFIGMIFLNSY